MKTNWKRKALLVVALVQGMIASPLAWSQSGSSILNGTIVDTQGTVIPNAAVVIRNEATSQIQDIKGDAAGHFMVSHLGAGTYTVEASAPGFALTSKKGVVLSDGQSQQLTLTLNVGGFAQQVTVEASTSNSIAAQYAPMDGLLEARSARTEISSQFIQNFTSPVSDYAEIVQMAPGTFSVNSNGIGLGDAKTYFRGFADGSYDITYDGIPWNDTNSPTHHSWAFFPGPWIGSVDYDRSPGSASTIGPTPFGGSINLLSKDVPADPSIRGGINYGSFNTIFYDGSWDAGRFPGRNGKSSLSIDVHRMTSDGYQTYNHQSRTAGSLKYQYKFSDNTVLTGFSGVIRLNANTPNQKGATRSQIAQFGDNFLLNNDPTSPLYYKFNTYYVPTDFEYVGLRTQLGHGWNLDVKPYTYSYYNQQFYNNGTSITSSSATDKLNSYRKYGETFTASQVSRFGILRTGLWYEWATTNRYQIPSDPRTHVDQVLPNFHERFYTNSYQPFAEYEYHATRKLTLTGGMKFAHYTMDLTQYADNGKTVGNLGGKPFVNNQAGYTSYLPSFDASYRIRENWSVYGQVATGSIIPPSSVFDVTNGRVVGLPKPSSAITYQGGSVAKFRRMTLNGDFYYVHYGNAYSASADPNNPIYTSQGDSVTKGFEGEGNFYLYRGLSFYANGTVGSARYVSAIVGGQPNPNNNLWVANTPSNTQTWGLTYQQKYLDLGILNKRIGPMWNDGTAVSTTNAVIGTNANQVVPIDPFNVTNLFFNYTVRNGSRFDQTKLRLSFNNIFDSHNITGVTPAVKGSTFVPNGGDVLQLLPGRSVMLSVTFGFSPRGL